MVASLLAAPTAQLGGGGDVARQLLFTAGPGRGQKGLGPCSGGLAWPALPQTLPGCSPRDCTCTLEPVLPPEPLVLGEGHAQAHVHPVPLQ